MDKRRYELLIEEGYTSEELTYDEFVIATNDLEYENPTEYLKNWRETRVGVLTHDMGQAEGHKQFLEELRESIENHGSVWDVKIYENTLVTSD